MSLPTRTDRAEPPKEKFIFIKYKGVVARVVRLKKNGLADLIIEKDGQVYREYDVDIRGFYVISPDGKEAPPEPEK